MTRREAFRQLREAFYTKISPYCRNKDPELHGFCLNKVESLTKEFDKSAQLNGLPQPTYRFFEAAPGTPSEGVVISDFGGIFCLFFEITMKECFENKLNEEIPNTYDE
jgi:hypothetical protein